MRPTIGITSTSTLHKQFPNAPSYIGQQHTYVNAVLRAGGLPLLLPIVDDIAVLREYYKRCDGILFAGGNDLTPALYGTEEFEASSEGTFIERDEQELQLWQWTERDDKPVLGICRGLQLINVACGGTLYQDIPTELPNAGIHRIPATESTKEDYFTILHRLDIEIGSKLASILGVSGIDANSFHHQAVKDLGQGLAAVAWAEDGVIEGVEMPNRRFVVALQSHPEALEKEVVTAWRKLFTAFIKTSDTRISLRARQQVRSLLTR